MTNFIVTKEGLELHFKTFSEEWHSILDTGVGHNVGVLKDINGNLFNIYVLPADILLFCTLDEPIRSDIWEGIIENGVLISKPPIYARASNTSLFSYLKKSNTYITMKKAKPTKTAKDRYFYLDKKISVGDSLEFKIAYFHTVHTWCGTVVELSENKIKVQKVITEYTSIKKADSAEHSNFIINLFKSLTT